MTTFYRSILSKWGVLLAILLVTSGNPGHGADGDDSSPVKSPTARPVGQMLPLGDFGADEVAFVAIPATPPTVGIVLVPDAYGLDVFTKAEAMRLANLGYLVAAVDIYNGHQTTDPGILANMTANLDAASIMKTINAGIRLFHESPSLHVDHVVAMGWGVGATYVFEAARENKGLDGAITFYGPVLTDLSSIKKFAAPLCAVYPDKDSVATQDVVQAFQRAMKAAGNDCDAWFIAAGRGWSNPQSKTYNAPEDREAWKVAMPFLIRIAAEPVKPKDGSLIDKTGATLDKATDSIKNIFK